MTPRPPQVAQPPQLTIALVNQKGGVGKTTLATNLAAAAHLAGHRTVILDLDPQGSAFDWYRARQPGSKLDGLTVVRSDKALNLKRFQEQVAGYDVAILDGPPRLGDILTAAVVAADVALIPLRPGPYDWWAADETLRLVDSADAVREHLSRPPVRRVFVLNSADARTKIVRDALDALGQVGELAPVVIAPRVAYAATAIGGEAVLTLAPDGPAADEVNRLWRALEPGDVAQVAHA